MPEYFNTWDDGNKKWVKKQGNTRTPEQERYDFKNILTVSLVGCDIKTDIVNESWMIVHDGILHRHYLITEMKRWELSENIITLYNGDDEPFKLLFTTSTQAKKGDNRLFLIMNGKSVIGCEDDQPFECADIRNINVSF